MFQAVCADCKKDCEIPFKPSGDRPVYCKECFSRRKSSRVLNVSAQASPKAVPAVVPPVAKALEPSVKKVKKPAAAKKPAAKKKPAPKKKK